MGYITLGRNWANIFNWCTELQIIFSPKGSECNFAIREFGKVQGQAWSNNHIKSIYCLSDNKDDINCTVLMALCISLPFADFTMYINGPRRSRCVISTSMPHLYNLNMSVKWIEKRLNLVQKTNILFVYKNYEINYYAYFSKVDLTKKPSLSTQWSLIRSFVRDFVCISFVWLTSLWE